MFEPDTLDEICDLIDNQITDYQDQNQQQQQYQDQQQSPTDVEETCSPCSSCR